MVGAFLLAGSLSLTGEGGVTTTDAARARDLLEAEAGEEPRAQKFVLVEANDGPLDEQLFARVVGSIVADVVSYQDGEASLRTSNGRKAIIQVTTSLGQDEDDFAPGDPVLAVIDEASESSGLRVTTIDLTPENRSTCRDRETVQVWMKGEQDEQAEAVRG